MLKKIYLIFTFIILLTGCSNNKNKDEEEKIIVSTGTLECVLKENRIYDNSLYTSHYIFNYNKNGVLETVENYETLNVKNVENKNKEKYKDSYLKTATDTKMIDGTIVEDLSKEDIYKIKVIYDIKKMKQKDIEDYDFNLDRKSTYNIFTKNKYTCE